MFVRPSAPCQAAKSDVAATKATTKRALLTGLRNGNLEKAVEKMEADEEAATEPEPEPEVRLRSPRAHFSPCFAALPAQPSTILAFQGTGLRSVCLLMCSSIRLRPARLRRATLLPLKPPRNAPC